jgi:hypothetical protein
MSDKRPLAVIRAEQVADVIAAVNYARTGPRSVHVDGCTRERREPRGGEVMAVACRRNLGLDGGDRTLIMAGKGDHQHRACR